MTCMNNCDKVLSMVFGLLQVAEGAANANVYDKKRMSFRLGRAITMLLRGNSCFDFNLYRARSRDLPGTMTDEQIWDHFVHDGQFEGRPFRCCVAQDRPYMILCGSIH